MARTIIATWHGMSLHITAHRCIDKKGHEFIVFQAATYSAKPSQHIQTFSFFSCPTRDVSPSP